MKIKKNIITDSLDYLEQTLKPDCDVITVEVINRIRKIFELNEIEKNKKISLLDKLPKLNFIYDKKMKTIYDLIHLKKEYGYWLFKKIEELFPEASFPMDLEAEYNRDNSIIPYYLDHLILINEFVVIKDVMAHDGKIVIVDSENNIYCDLWDHFVSVNRLYDEVFMRNINQALNKYNINQRINTTNGEFVNPDGAKVYITGNLKNHFYDKAPIDYYDVLVVSDGQIRNLQVNKMGYVRENRNLDLLSQKDKQKNTSISRKRIRK